MDMQAGQPVAFTIRLVEGDPGGQNFEAVPVRHCEACDVVWRVRKPRGRLRDCTWSSLEAAQEGTRKECEAASVKFMGAYERACKEADERFAPLRAEMLAFGWPEDQCKVEQTGGMVMCLALYGLKKEGAKDRYMYVGDPRDDDHVTACTDDEDGEFDNFEGESPAHTDPRACAVWLTAELGKRGHYPPDDSVRAAFMRAYRRNPVAAVLVFAWHPNVKIWQESAENVAWVAANHFDDHKGRFVFCQARSCLHPAHAECKHEFMTIVGITRCRLCNLEIP